MTINNRGRNQCSCAYSHQCGNPAYYYRDGHWWCDDHSPVRGQALIDSLTRTLAVPA